MLDGIKNNITIFIGTFFIVTFLILSGCLNYQDKNVVISIIDNKMYSSMRELCCFLLTKRNNVV